MFKEYSFVCPACGESKFKRRDGFHLIGRYHCHSCKTNFYQPTQVINRTSSIRHGYENFNKYNQRNSNSKRTKIIITTILVIGLIIACIKIPYFWLIPLCAVLFIALLKYSAKRKH